MNRNVPSRPHSSLSKLPLLLRGALAAAAGLFLSACGASSVPLTRDTSSEMIVSVRDQRMLLVQDGQPVKTYRISTSKFGLGDEPGSNRTPLGTMEVARKIGCGHPEGAVFKSRRPTGEVLPPNAPGRDPIVSRILWLQGTEPHNRNAFRRYIYIHGTPEESRLGTPASYGCIRMGLSDMVELYDHVGYRARVRVIRGGLTETPEGQAYAGNFIRRLRRPI